MLLTQDRSDNHYNDERERTLSKDYCYDYKSSFLVECCETEEVTLVNRKRRRQSNQPIRGRSKYR